jgi:hypothetical protein
MKSLVLALNLNLHKPPNKSLCCTNPTMKIFLVALNEYAFINRCNNNKKLNVPYQVPKPLQISAHIFAGLAGYHSNSLCGFLCT